MMRGSPPISCMHRLMLGACRGVPRQWAWVLLFNSLYAFMPRSKLPLMMALTSCMACSFSSFAGVACISDAIVQIKFRDRSVVAFPKRGF